VTPADAGVQYHGVEGVAYPLFLNRFLRFIGVSDEYGRVPGAQKFDGPAADGRSGTEGGGE